MVLNTTVPEVVFRVNRSIHNLFRIDEHLNHRPLVCISCDRFLNFENTCYIGAKQLEKKKHIFMPTCATMNNTVSIEYKISASPFLSRSEYSNLRKCLLSPRALYVQQTDRRKTSGFTICKECYNHVKRGTTPVFCIANNFSFGKTPQCLQKLTQVELAMITPIRTFGYCFTYTGGVQKQLKGTLAYYKVSAETIVRTGGNLQKLGLNDHIIILLYGKLTPDQKQKAQKKYSIHTGRIISAIRWLVDNNCYWQPYKHLFLEIVSCIRCPTIVDNASIVHPESSTPTSNNVENTETFQVFYPDGNVSTMTGGQDNIDAFQEVIQEATKEGFRIECRMSILSSAVADYKDNNLVQACLLQFPYGIGGLSDNRVTGKINNLLSYTSYLSMISLPQFQSELFTLQLYNMQLKYIMMDSARWKVRNRLFSEFISSGITTDDIDIAIENKRNGRAIDTSRGSSFLGAIDAICKAVPHTNEAATVARRGMETMQHHFGCPTFFLTVTPDDDNHMLIQILTQTNLHKGKSVDDMSDDEIFQLSSSKTELRISFPGIAALFFELMLDIVLKDVIGWDKSTNSPTSTNNNLFGKVKAVTVTVEEQGRRTLHAHILIWEQFLSDERNILFTGTEHAAREAKVQIISKIDELCSTAFFFSDDHRPPRMNSIRRAFPHNCSRAEAVVPSCPRTVSGQQLRNLRCKRTHDLAFAECTCCKHIWTQTDFVTSYLQNYVCVPGIGTDYIANGRRLKAKTTEFQLLAPIKSVALSYVVDGAYNQHVHCSSCFKHNFDSCHCTALGEECRFKYPKPKKTRTTIQDISTETQSWYLWDGTRTERLVKEIAVKRTAFDKFQNVCCPHITYSKLTCNTNLSFLLPGPVAQYCVSYTMKNTQKEETQEYELVRSATEKILSKTKEDDTSDSIAIRRLLASSFAHQSNNIVGAPMASYLTRNNTRFYFSHKFSWCPIRDLFKLLNGERINVNVSFTEYSAHFQSLSLNYLCRPNSLEHVSVFDFYSKYEAVRVSSTNKLTLLPFQNNRYFKHPSYNPKTKEYRQGLRERDEHALPKVYQYDFADTATFGGSIFSPATPTTFTTEEYSRNVLLLFHPFRKLNDLMFCLSYTLKLRQLFHSHSLHPQMHSFLQNLQDCKSNNLRNISTQDELQRSTLPPTPNTNYSTNIENDIDGVCTDQLLDFNNILHDDDNGDDSFDQLMNGDELDIQHNNIIPSFFTCTTLRGQGRHNCGYSDLPKFDSTATPSTHDFIHTSGTVSATPDDEIVPIHRMQPNQEDLVQILLTQNGEHQVSFSDITGQPNRVSVMKPNGSAKSIINWAEQSGLDYNQQRAFEVMTSSFVLSYYNTPDSVINTRATYLAEKKKLMVLAHNNKRKNNQLICLMHGPGGSGKSAVINLVVLYANTFCTYIWSDLSSSDRVIVVTALTGVAATLLRGETTHSALFLNQKKDLTRDQIQLWSGTKMIIIDEVSFASKHDITMIHTKLSKLKQQPFQRYGGTNVVFCGDFRQLEPVGANKNPIYADNIPEFRDWINCYIELNGMWRFRNDLKWGRLLRRIRDGNARVKDINTINTHIHQNNILPTDIRYACYHNRDRDAINTAIFEERLLASYTSNGPVRGFILVFSDNIRIQDTCNVYTPIRKPLHFWETYGENDIKISNSTGRMDPVLKLYIGCPVMLPTNISVASGLANGTQATVRQITFKEGEHPSVTTVNTIPVLAAFASQLTGIQLLHSNTNYQPQLFTVSPKTHTFTLNKRKMKATQIPILLNNATTGHKLQGSGVDHIFVHNWSYVTNWVYVMLSRVKTMQGLYARHFLSTDISKYAVKDSYKTMVMKFRTKRPGRISNDEYNLLSM